MRALQERRIAQEMEFAAAEHEQKVKEWQDKIQFQAEMAKAGVAFSAAVNPSETPWKIDLGGEFGVGGIERMTLPGKAPSEAALEHLLPVVSKFSPKDTLPFLANVSLMRQREIEAEKERKLADFRPSVSQVGDVQFAQEAPGRYQAHFPPAAPAPSELEKNLKLLQAAGVPITITELKDKILGGDSALTQKVKLAGEAAVRVAKLEGITDEKELAKIQARAESEVLVPAGTETEITTPEGVTLRIGKPGKASSVPQAMVTRLSERINQSKSGIAQLTDVQTTIRPKDVGVRGVAGEFFLDRLFPSLGIPFVGDPTRMENREKIVLAREALLRDVSGDTRFSNNDRKAIEKALPSSGWVESKPNIQEASEVIKRMLAKRMILDSIDLKQNPPKLAFDILTDQMVAELGRMNIIPPTMLLSLVEQGIISKERAGNIYKLQTGK
jgi:hypothetical protein